MHDGPLLLHQNHSLVPASLAEYPQDALHSQRPARGTVLVMQMARHIAILGVALAFTSPLPSHQKDTPVEESGRGE